MARTPSADHVLGRKDADRDLLIEAALGDQADALVAWQRWRSSGERRDIGSIASRWLPLVAQNLDAQRLDTASASMLGAAVRGVTRFPLVERFPRDAEPPADTCSVLLARRLLQYLRSPRHQACLLSLGHHPSAPGCRA